MPFLMAALLPQKASRKKIKPFRKKLNLPIRLFQFENIEINSNKDMLRPIVVIAMGDFGGLDGC